MAFLLHSVKWGIGNIVGIWEGMLLTTKLNLMMEKYNIHVLVRTYALLISGISAGGFIVLLILTLQDCSTTKYVSYTKKVADAGSNSETECFDVPTSVSDSYFLSESGYWSTQANYLAKDTLFKTTFQQFGSSETQFAGYMNELHTSLETFGTQLKQSSYSRAIGRILTYRNGSWADPMYTIPFFDVNSIFKPESATMSYYTHCGDGFSPLGGLYLSLGSSGYSYDRTFHVQGKTTSDGPIITFSLNVIPTEDPFDLKSILDGSSSLFGDPSDTIDDDDLYDMPGFVDDVSIKLEEDECPPGFTGLLSSEGLVCALSFDLNVYATVAAINDAVIGADVSEVLVLDGDTGSVKYTTRNFISSEIIVLRLGVYYLSIESYLFKPSFEHYFCNTTASCTNADLQDPYCAFNDFILKLEPEPFQFNETSQTFTADPFLTNCELFAPLYSGPNTNDDSEECTFDSTYSCVASWLADGYCDDANNNDCCGWDFGDCCESTCLSTTFSCGEAGYFCCASSDYCSSTCSLNCSDVPVPLSRRLDEVDISPVRVMSDHEKLGVLRKKAAVNSKVRKASQERNAGRADGDDDDVQTAIKLGMAEIRRSANTASSSSASDDSMLTEQERSNIKRFDQAAALLNGNLPLVDPTHRVRSRDVKDRMKHHEGQPTTARTVTDGMMTSGGRRMTSIPSAYTSVVITSGSGDFDSFEANLTSFNVTETGGYGGYGYINLQRGAEQSYMCYSRAVQQVVHLCPAICSKQFSTFLTPFNDDDSEYGGFLASTGTMAHAYDLGRAIMAGGTGAGFIMPTGITYEDDLDATTQQLYIAGSRATASSTVAADTTYPFLVGYLNESALACELAVCYCYERVQNGVDFDSELNTISTKNFVNDFYSEMDEFTANCNNPYEKATKKLDTTDDAPVELLESYFNCETTQCPDFISAVGSVLANVTTGVTIVALVFSFLITDFYLPKIAKVDVEDWRKDDGAFEEAVMSMLEKNAMMEEEQGKGEALEQGSEMTKKVKKKVEF